MADNVKQTAANALIKAANESLASKVKDTLKKLVEARRAVTNLEAQVEADIAATQADIEAINASVK